MNTNQNDPWQDPPSFQGMEDTLRDACERAMQLAFPLPTMLRLYRMVIGLTRALMRARKDVGLPSGLSDELIALLDTVRDTTGLHFPDPDMPVEDAMRLHAAMIKLAQIAHRARVGRLTGTRVGWERPRAATQPPAEPEEAAPPATNTEEPPVVRGNQHQHRPDKPRPVEPDPQWDMRQWIKPRPAQAGGSGAKTKNDPMHREKPEPRDAVAAPAEQANRHTNRPDERPWAGYPGENEIAPHAP